MPWRTFLSRARGRPWACPPRARRACARRAAAVAPPAHGGTRARASARSLARSSAVRCGLRLARSRASARACAVPWARAPPRAPRPPRRAPQPQPRAPRRGPPRLASPRRQPPRPGLGPRRGLARPRRASSACLFGLFVLLSSSAITASVPCSGRCLAGGPRSAAARRRASPSPSAAEFSSSPVALRKRRLNASSRASLSARPDHGRPARGLRSPSLPPPLRLHELGLDRKLVPGQAHRLAWRGPRARPRARTSPGRA